MPPILHARRTLADLRAAAAVAPVRPAWAAGVRAALAVVVPLGASLLFGAPGGLWMSIAALNGVFADRGGSYRARAVTLALMTATSAVLAAVATVVGGDRLLLAVPLAFVVAGAVSLARAWGSYGAGASVPVLLTFLVALSLPAEGPRAAEAVERFAFVLAGGAWAMLLTFALWPLRPYRPVRLAVALCYRELAEHLAEVGRRVAAGEPLGADLLAARASAVRRAVEQAGEVLATTRRGRAGETGRGERLVQLHALADRLFVHAIGLADTLASVEPADRDAAGQVVLAASLADAAASMRLVADATESERETPPQPVAWSGAPLRAPLAASPGMASDAGATGQVNYPHAAALLDRMAGLAAAAASAAAGLESGRYGTVIAPGPSGGGRGVLAVAAGAVRAVVAPGSLLLRHALRVALVTAAAVLLTVLLDLPYGYWITITAVVVLQPYTGATTQRAIQRVAGTVLGGAVAAGLSAVFHDPVAVLALVAFFVALCIALLPLSYAAFSVFVTPAFVLLVEVGVGEWNLAGVRVLNSVVGGVLALAAARLLWPEPEWSRLPSHLAAALRACRDYLRVVAGVVADAGRDDEAAGEDAAERMGRARREVGLAAINAEESFQRLLGEHAGPASRLEPAMAVLAGVRNVANSVAGLALARHAPEPGRPHDVRRVAAAADRALDDLADAVGSGRPPPPLPELPDVGGEPAAPVLLARLDRLERHLEALHHAVTRWTEAREPGDAGTVRDDGAGAGGQPASLPATSTSLRA